MKFLTFALALLVFLCGCAEKDTGISDALYLRQRISQGNGYSYQAVITADYGDCTYEFTMDCEIDKDGTQHFTLIKPETICGITGVISQVGGKLIFDDNVLLFEPMNRGTLIPAVGPWLMFKAVSGGYIRSGTDSKINQITIDDSFEGELFQLLLTVNEGGDPVFGEIIFDNRRILSIKVNDFKVL